MYTCPFLLKKCPFLPGLRCPNFLFPPLIVVLVDVDFEDKNDQLPLTDFQMLWSIAYAIFTSSRDKLERNMCHDFMTSFVVLIAKIEEKVNCK